VVIGVVFRCLFSFTCNEITFRCTHYSYSFQFIVGSGTCLDLIYCCVVFYFSHVWNENNLVCLLLVLELDWIWAMCGSAGDAARIVLC
jgi:hypothetical protein